MLLPQFRTACVVYRRLPHFYDAGRTLFITFRLSGTLPMGRSFGGGITSGKAFLCMDRLLDECLTGPTRLAVPAVASMVCGAIRNSEDYELHAWVVMPNHVHLLITPRGDASILLRRLKGATARYGNELLGRTGTFWQHESYYHVVRNADEFWRIANYIVQNPVRAGLALSAEEYLWSSGKVGLKPSASFIGSLLYG